MIDLIETKQLKAEIEQNYEHVQRIIENTALDICITEQMGIMQQ